MYSTVFLCKCFEYMYYIQLHLDQSFLQFHCCTPIPGPGGGGGGGYHFPGPGGGAGMGSGDSAAKRELAKWRAVCLLRSGRRTFLLYIIYLVTTFWQIQQIFNILPIFKSSNFCAFLDCKQLNSLLMGMKMNKFT